MGYIRLGKFLAVRADFAFHADDRYTAFQKQSGAFDSSLFLFLFFSFCLRRHGVLRAARNRSSQKSSEPVSPNGIPSRSSGEDPAVAPLELDAVPSGKGMRKISVRGALFQQPSSSDLSSPAPGVAPTDWRGDDIKPELFALKVRCYIPVSLG